MPLVSAAPTSPAAERVPAYKKWWLWTAVGVAAVGVGLGVGLGLGLSHKSNNTTLPDFGPAASRF